MQLQFAASLFGLVLLTYFTVDGQKVQDEDGCVWDLKNERLTYEKKTFWRRCVYNCTLNGKLVVNKKLKDLSMCQVLGTGVPLPPTVGVCRNGNCVKK
uniref:BTSP n=1 Tax=Argas monolakensis TaxID=34602 RepID=Q09JV3_ARGMO|nr:BTSP [Argas monolakensis]